MGTVCVLKTANVEVEAPGPKWGTPGAHPASLLAFLRAENLRLQHAVAELERDTMALQEALRDN